MAKTVGLKIEIDGLGSITEQIVKLEQALKSSKDQAKALESEIEKLNKELEGAEEGTEDYKRLNAELEQAQKEYLGLRSNIARTNEELKGARKEQRDFIKQANAAKFKKGSYFDLNEQLKKLKKEFKNLSEAERKGAVGQQLKKQIGGLDKELKKIDGSIGQYQRNVGNYAQALNNVVPGLSRLSKALTNAQGKLNIFGKAIVAGFVAFKAAQFVGRAIKQLDEFITKIDETRQAVAGFAEASGDELNKLTAETSAISETFNVSSEQIAKSAKALADKLGIGFDEALAKIEGRLVEGVANNEDFLSSVEQYPEAFEDASGAVTDFSEQNKKLLDTNKELATSQVEVAEKLKPTVQAIKQTGEQIKTGLLVFLSQLITTFKPVIASAQEWGKSLSRLVGQLFGAGDATRGFQNILKGIATVIDANIKLSVKFFDALSAGVAYLRGDASQAYKLFTREGQLLAKAEEKLAETTQELTAEFQQETKELNSLFGQLANTNENTDERRKLIEKLNQQYGDYLPNIDLEKAGQKELEQAYNDTTEAIARNLVERKKIQLRDELSQKTLENITIIEKERLARQKEFSKLLEVAAAAKKAEAAGDKEAFKRLEKERKERRKAFDDGIQARANAKVEREEQLKIAKEELKLIDEASDAIVSQFSDFLGFEKAKTKARKKEGQNRKEVTQEELKAQRDALKELQKARDKFAAEELRKAQQRAALLADLEARLLDQRIAAIEDERERREQEINVSFDRQVKAIEAGNAKLKDEAAKREQELIKIFGEGSKEVLQARENFTNEFVKIEQAQTDIIKNLRQEEQAKLADLDKEFRLKELEDAKKAAADLRAFRDTALSSELAFIEQGAKMRELKNQETLNNLLAQEEDAQARAEAIRVAGEQKIIDEIALIRNKLQALEDAEAELLDESGELRLDIKQSEYDAILQARQELNTQLSALELEQTENVRAEAEKQAEAFAQAFEKVSGQFTTGLKAFDSILDTLDSNQEQSLQESIERSQQREAQLSDELQNATGLRKKFLQQQVNQELEQQRLLEKQKEALQLRAAKREQAIAITESIIQGIIAVTRAVASPPFYPANLPTVLLTGSLAAANTAAIAAKKFEDGGVIQGPSHSQGGVPFTVAGTPGFEAEGGEFIINKKATAKFLPVLQRINSVKFAEGGLIGGVSPTPTITNINTVQADSVQALAGALAGAINTQQVVLVTDDLDEDRENQERIKKRTTFK